MFTWDSPIRYVSSLDGSKFDIIFQLVNQSRYSRELPSSSDGNLPIRSKQWLKIFKRILAYNDKFADDFRKNLKFASVDAL